MEVERNVSIAFLYVLNTVIAWVYYMYIHAFIYKLMRPASSFQVELLARSKWSC